MSETDLQITFNAVDLGVLKTLDAVITGLDKLKRGSDKVAAGMKTAFMNLAQNIKQNMNKISSAMQGTANSIQNAFTGTFAKILGALGFAGFVGTLKKSLSMASETEDAMLKLSAAMRKPIAEMGKYVDMIDDLEKKTKQEDTVLAAGLTKAVQMNVKGLEDVQKAQELLYSAEKLSTVGNMDYGESVNFLSSNLVAFNKDASESQKMIETIYKASELGGKGVDQFAQAMQPLASIASDMGISFEDLSGVLSAVGKNTKDLGRVSMELRSFLFALQKPNKELNQILKAMGGEYKTVQELIKKEGFLKFIQIMKSVTGGNASVMGKIFDARSMRSIMALTGRVFEDFKKNVGEVKKGSDELTKKYDEMAKSYSYQLNILQKQWDDVIKELGTRLMPFAMDKINQLTGWLKQNGDQLAESMKNLAIYLTKIFTLVVSNLKIIIPLLASLWAVGKFNALVEFLATGYAWIVKISTFLMANPWVAALTVALGLIVKIYMTIKGIREEADLAAKRAREGQMNKSPEELKKEFNTERAKSFGQKMKIGGVEYQLGPGGARNITPKAFVGPNQPSADEMEKFNFKNEAERKAEEEWKKKHEAALKELHTLQMNLMSEEQKINQQHQDAILAADKMVWANKEEKAKYIGLLEDSFLKKHMDLTEKMNDAEIEAAKKRLEFEEANIKKISAYRDEKNQEQLDAEKYLYDLRLEGATESDKLLNSYLDRIDEIRSMKGLNDQQKEEATTLVTKKYEDDKQKTTIIGKVFESVKEQSKNFMNEVVIGFFRKAGEQFYDVVMSGLDNITSLLQMPFSKISDVMSKIMEGGGVDEVQSMVQGIVTFIEKLSAKLPAAIEWFAKVGVIKILNAFVKALPGIITALVDNIPLILDAIIEKLDDIIIPLVNGILRLIPKLIERIPDIITAIIKLIPPIIAEIIKAIPSIAWSLAKAIVEWIKDLLTGFGILGDNPNDSTGKKVAKFGGKVAMGAAAGAAIGSVVPVVGTAIGAIGGAIIGGLGDLLDWWHEGGTIDERDKSNVMGRLNSFSKAMRAHKGAYVRGGLSSSDVPIIAQVGEAVMNRSFVNSVGGKNEIERMNRTGKLPGGNVVNHVYVENMMSDDTPMVIDKMLERNYIKGSGSYYQRVRGKVPGYATVKK